MHKEFVKNWFSNMIPFDSPLIHDGISYNAPENFYQAMKVSDPETRRMIAELPPRKSKVIGRKLQDIQLSDEERIMNMKFALRHKFAHGTTWAEKLLDTGDEEIVEWNNWGDSFFGRDIETKVGKNHLGKILMAIRNELKLERELR